VSAPGKNRPAAAVTPASNNSKTGHSHRRIPTPPPAFYLSAYMEIKGY
jgi:hypothetical protein